MFPMITESVQQPVSRPDCVTVGHSFSGALETLVYSSCHVSVPTWTGELPACMVTAPVWGRHPLMEEQESSLLTTGVQT